MPIVIHGKFCMEMPYKRLKVVPTGVASATRTAALSGS